jgi:hypothetical protein
MAVAVMAAVLAGQPNAAGPASGRSVPLSSASAEADLVPRIVYLAHGALGCYSAASQTSTVQRLPAGVAVRSALLLGRGVLALGSNGMAYLWHDGTLTRLGLAGSAVPTYDGSGAWLSARGRARRIDLQGRPVPGPWIAVPANSWLVGTTRSALIATSGTAVVPGETMQLQAGMPPVVLTHGRALSVAAGKVLVGNGNRLSLLDLRAGTERRLPTLTAVIATGEGTLSPDGNSFAVTARTVDHRRLIVGPTTAGNAGSLRVLPLTNEPQQHIPPGAGRMLAEPRWVADQIVLAARTDGRLVEYELGTDNGWLPRHAPAVVSDLARGLSTTTAACPGRAVQ